MFISRRRLAEEAQTILSDLGTSADEVATSFVKCGIRARAGNSSSDLLALYLNAVMGADWRVHSIEVAGHWAQIRAGRSQAVVVELPEAVSRFMFMFDAWHFCHETDAFTQNQQGEKSPATGEPDEASETS